MAKTTTITTISADIRKISSIIATYYGPLDNSEITYERLVNTLVPNTFSDIKIVCNNSAIITSYGGKSNTISIEWFGYAGLGEQFLGLIYTSTEENKDISLYDKIMMETDSFSSSNKKEIFSYGAFFSDVTYSGDTYTLTYDIITYSEVESQTTTLQKESLVVINSFVYGFIKTNTADTTISTAGTYSDSIELISYSKSPVILFDTNIWAVSGVSYTVVQTISTTSNFTQFVELSGLNEATSFEVRSFATITSPYTSRANGQVVSAGTGAGYSFAPIFTQSVLTIRPPESPTFYTEKASFGSFADPNYSTAYKNCSPEDCSLVFLALVALNTDASSYADNEANKYPSWISVYNGTFSGNDRASTSLESVTVSQSSSYVGAGSTNVYQTITYFIGNNSASQTTGTRSIPMILQNQASSVSRLARTVAENLSSAYINSWLPSIPLRGENVVYTQGLQADAGYNISGTLMNAYTTNQSTFAESATSSFPISVSQMGYFVYRNKIRIDSAYEVTNLNSFNRMLLRYSAFEFE
jgi:hypothetical protein